MKDRFARGIVNRKAEMQPRAVRRGGFGIRDRLAQRGGNSVAASDDAQPDAFFDAMRSFHQQVFVQKAENRIDFRGGALPIRGGEREQRKSMNAEARRRFDDSPGGFGPCAVPGGARQSARGRPAAVAVRNDGYVKA